MLHALLGTLSLIWIVDGLALLAAPRGVMALLKQYIQQQQGVSRWWAVTSGLGAALLWVPMSASHQPLWVVVGLLMLLKGLFLGLAPERWRASVITWCLSREDVDYRFWGLGLCMLAVLLARTAGLIGSHTTEP